MRGKVSLADGKSSHLTFKSLSLVCTFEQGRVSNNGPIHASGHTRGIHEDECGCVSGIDPVISTPTSKRSVEGVNKAAHTSSCMYMGSVCPVRNTGFQIVGKSL